MNLGKKRKIFFKDFSANISFSFFNLEIVLERIILKKYIFSFIFFLKRVYISFYVLFIFYFLLLYLYFSFYILFIFFIYFFLIFFFLFFFFEKLIYLFFFFKYWLNIVYRYIYFIYLYIYIILRNYFFLGYIVFFFLKKYLCFFLFYFFCILKIFFYFFYLSYLFFLFFIYFFDIISINVRSYIYIYILKILYINFFKYKKLKSKNFLNIYKKKINKIYKNLKFYYDLIFFFFTERIFFDYYIFFLGDSHYREGLNSELEITYTKHKAARHFFGISGYFLWYFHILRYKVLIPFSEFLSKMEWEWYALQMRVFFRWNYTFLEKYIYKIIHFFRLFFFLKNSRVYRKQIFSDICLYLFFFLWEDLIFYYFQISLFNYLLFFNFKRWLVFFIKKLKFNKKLYFVFKIIILYIFKIYKIIILNILKNFKNMFFVNYKLIRFFIFIKFKYNLFVYLLLKYILVIFYKIKNLKDRYLYLIKIKNSINMDLLKNREELNAMFWNYNIRLFNNYKSEKYFLFFKWFLKLINIKSRINYIEDEKILEKSMFSQVVWIHGFGGTFLGIRVLLRFYKMYLDFVELKFLEYKILNYDKKKKRNKYYMNVIRKIKKI